MTEEEALKKWCPFVRLVVREDGNYRETWAQTNRGEDVNCSTGTTCIGSTCMAWRWLQLSEPKESGYCGLAGEPK